MAANKVILIFSLIALAVATNPEQSGPFQSDVVTADQSANPPQEALVDFDELPLHLQRQVMDILENKNEQPVVQNEQPAENPSQQVIELEIPNEQLNDPSKPLVGEIVFQVQDAPPVEDKPQELVLQMPIDEQGQQQLQDGVPYIFNTDQLPADVREDVIRQLNLISVQSANDPAQQQEGQQSLEKLADNVADVLVRMAANDPNGEQGIDFNDLPPEIRTELSNYLAKQVDNKAEKVKEQDNQKQNAGLQTAAAVGGGLLGGLISGAVGGGYPGGYPGYPGAGAGYPGGGYRPGYPGSGYPGAGYPGAGYPGAGYPGGGYPGGGYPGGGYPGAGAGYYPGGGYPQQGGYYPGGQYGSGGHRPNRPGGYYPSAYYHNPVASFSNRLPSYYSGAQRPAYGVVLSREQLAGLAPYGYPFAPVGYAKQPVGYHKPSAVYQQPALDDQSVRVLSQGSVYQPSLKSNQPVVFVLPHRNYRF